MVRWAAACQQARRRLREERGASGAGAVLVMVVLVVLVVLAARLDGVAQWAMLAMATCTRHTRMSAALAQSGSVRTACNPNPVACAAVTFATNDDDDDDDDNNNKVLSAV